jgi:hypothetical protein
MNKKYFCKSKINDEECGETNPENFEIGRYSTCKECRSKNITQKSVQRKNLEIIDKVRRIDPGEEIRTVVDYTINHKAFDGDFSIVESIKNINEQNRKILEKISVTDTDKNEIFQNFENLETKLGRVGIAFNTMIKKIEDLEYELIEIKKKSNLDLIFERLKDLENFKRDCLDEKIKNQK